LTFDELDDKQERVDFFVSCVPLMESAPREVTGGGVHVSSSRRLSSHLAHGLSVPPRPSTKAPEIDGVMRSM
jgi:hypothetical protein